jgi:uncharacterized repeat protein (TIGR02543 family)
MMKKGIYAILAVLAVFALVMTGCPGEPAPGPGPGPGPQVKITFDLNYTGAPAAEVVEVGLKTALGSNYPADPTQVGFIFQGWNSEDDGNGNTITGNTKFSNDTTVYAQWAAYTTGDVKVTFNYNYPGATPATTVRVTTATNTVTPFPGTPGRSGYTFTGWFKTNAQPGGGGDRFTAASGADSTDFTVYARWAAAGSKPNLENDQVRFQYEDGTWQDIVFESGDTGADVIGKLSRKTDVKDEASYFKAWQAGSTPLNNTDPITSSTTFTAQWMNGAFAGTATGSEKFYSENMGSIVYEFDLGAGGLTAANLATIKGIKATYGLSEAGFDIADTQGAGNINWRAFGPYFFNGTADPITTGTGNSAKKWYGDFMLDKNNALVARMSSNATAPGTYDGDGTFNKFHTYFIHNGGGVIAGAESTPTPAQDTWFTTTLTFGTSDGGSEDGGGGTRTLAKTLRLLADVFANDGKDGAAGNQVLPEGTLDGTKVYFALGVIRRNAGNSGGKNGQQSPWDAGIISLIKDVKLIMEDPSDSTQTIEVDGVKPSLVIGSGATAQTITNVFAGYAPGDIHYAWRGEPTASVVIPADPTYVPPSTFPPALSSYTVKAPTLKLYQSDRTEGGTTMITFDGNKIIFNIGADNYNNGGAEGATKYGGGGFKILFDDIDLPEDYKAYKRIVLDTTLAETSSGSMATKQIIFSAPDGADVNSVNGSSNRWITIGPDGQKDFAIATTALTIASDGVPGIAVRANNYSNDNVPIQGTITVNRITFTLD